MLGFIQRNGSQLLKSSMVVIGALATVDFITYTYYEKERKQLTRITESFRNKFDGRGQFEILKSNCALLITPSLNNIHSFDQFKQMNDDYVTETNFRDLLGLYVNWQCPTLSFKNIPENQLTLITNYWDVMRKDAFKIKDKYFIYQLKQHEYVFDVDHDIETADDKNIIFEELTTDNINAAAKLNGTLIDKCYMEQIIESERVSIGAFDIANNKELIGYSYINIDDLSASKVEIHPKYNDKYNDIVLKLSQLTVNKHFEQNYNRLNVNIDVKDTQSIQMAESMGFKRLPQTYYWIESIEKTL